MPLKRAQGTEYNNHGWQSNAVKEISAAPVVLRATATLQEEAALPETRLTNVWQFTRLCLQIRISEFRPPFCRRSPARDRTDHPILSQYGRP